jgi:hypothetical protein
MEGVQGMERVREMRTTLLRSTLIAEILHVDLKVE